MSVLTSRLTKFHRPRGADGHFGAIFSPNEVGRCLARHAPCPALRAAAMSGSPCPDAPLSGWLSPCCVSSSTTSRQSACPDRMNLPRRRMHVAHASRCVRDARKAALHAALMITPCTRAQCMHALCSDARVAHWSCVLRACAHAACGVMIDCANDEHAAHTQRGRRHHATKCGCGSASQGLPHGFFRGIKPAQSRHARRNHALHGENRPETQALSASRSQDHRLRRPRAQR